MFDPCPSALAASRVASFKASDRLSGAWPDISGTYSLNNNNSTQIRRASEGRCVIGSSTMCDWQANQVWDATDSALLRNGQSFTKCVVANHTFADFSAQNALVVGIYADDTGGSMEASILRATNATMSWVSRQPSGTASTDAIASSPPMPLLLAYRYDSSIPQIGVRFMDVATGALLNQRTFSASLGNRTREYYGRRGTAAVATYNGTQAVIDCIQIFNSALPDSDLQLICSHLWRQKQLVDSFLRGQAT